MNKSQIEDDCCNDNLGYDECDKQKRNECDMLEICTHPLYDVDNCPLLKKHSCSQCRFVVFSQVEI